MAKKFDYEVVTGDWKEAEDIIHQMLKVFKQLGLYVYDAGRGSDTFAYVISKKKMSRSDLEDIFMG